MDHARPDRNATLLLALFVALWWPWLGAPLPLSAQGVLVRTQVRGTYHGELADRLGGRADDTVQVTRTVAVRGNRYHIEGFPERERRPSGEWAMFTIIDLDEDRAYVVATEGDEVVFVPLEELIEEVRSDAASLPDLEPEIRLEVTDDEAEVGGLPARRVLFTMDLGPDRTFGGDLHVFSEIWLSQAPELRPVIEFQRRMGQRLEGLGLGSGLDALRTLLGERASSLVPADPEAREDAEALRGVGVSSELFVVSVDEGGELATDALLRFEEEGQVPGQEVLIRAVSELVELRTGELPDSLFEPSRSTLMFLEPRVAEELAARIENEGVDAGVSWYRELARTAPTRHVHDPFELVGAARRFEDRPEVARALYELQAEAYPHDPDSYGFLGSLYRSRGMEERAVASYRRVLELDPWNPRARGELEEMGEEVAPPPEPVSLSPEALGELAGEYAGEFPRLGVHPLAEGELATTPRRFRLEPTKEGLRLVWIDSWTASDATLIPVSPGRFVDEGAAEGWLRTRLDFGYGASDEVEVFVADLVGLRAVARRVDGG